MFPFVFEDLVFRFISSKIMIFYFFPYYFRPKFPIPLWLVKGSSYINKPKTFCLRHTLNYTLELWLLYFVVIWLNSFLRKLVSINYRTKFLIDPKKKFQRILKFLDRPFILLIVRCVTFQENSKSTVCDFSGFC